MAFASPFRDVEIPNVAIYEMLFGCVDDATLNRIATIDAATGDQMTYRELIAGVDAVAGALTSRGVAGGDVVGLLAPNSALFVIAFHAIVRAGATATTINALFTASDVSKQLQNAGATVLVTVDSLRVQAEQAAQVTGITWGNVIVLDGAGNAATGHPNLDDLKRTGRNPPDTRIDPATHVAALPYSSGTTGNAKGVKLSHRNLVANVAQIQPVLGLVPEDRVLALLPFFHIYGLTVLLNTVLAVRATLVIMPKFDLTDMLVTIQDHRVTFGFIAPPVAVALAKNALVDQYDLSSMRTILSGAAPLDATLGEAVAARLEVTMLQGYGMSELSPVSHMMPRDGGRSAFGTRASLDSCGWAVPNTVNKLVDPDSGEEIDIPPRGLSEPGELWVAGPNVMLGYLADDDATKQTIDADGYLHTGDIARVDDSGAVFIVDRLKELIKYKGYQVPPAELEALLLTHPDVADAAVVGVTDEQGEEIPKAFIVRQADTNVSAEDVMDFVAERVAPYKRVRQVAFLDVIPKSSAGKILRRELRVAMHSTGAEPQ